MLFAVVERLREVVSTPICPGTSMKVVHVCVINVNVATVVFELCVCVCGFHDVIPCSLPLELFLKNLHLGVHTQFRSTLSLSQYVYVHLHVYIYIYTHILCVCDII